MLGEESGELESCTHLCVCVAFKGIFLSPFGGSKGDPKESRRFRGLSILHAHTYIHLYLASMFEFASWQRETDMVSLSAIISPPLAHAALFAALS